MKTDEAIRRIKEHMIVHHMAEEPYCYFITEALQMAINALEMQVDKKPYDSSKNPDDWHVMHCPSCNRAFWNSGDWMHYEPKWCEKCGQKIDWSDWHKM